MRNLGAYGVLVDGSEDLKIFHPEDHSPRLPYIYTAETPTGQLFIYAVEGYFASYQGGWHEQIVVLPISFSNESGESAWGKGKSGRVGSLETVTAAVQIIPIIIFWKRIIYIRNQISSQTAASLPGELFAPQECTTTSLKAFSSISKFFRPIHSEAERPFLGGRT